MLDHSGTRQRQSKSELRTLRLESLRITGLVSQIASEEFQKRIYRISDMDGMRLLRLKLWSRRYKVSIRFILQVLIPFWTRQFNKAGRFRSSSLGVRIITLTGRKSEEVLKEAIATAYPARENELEWRWEERERCLGLDQPKGRLPTIEHSPTVRDYIKAYRLRVTTRRNILDRAGTRSRWKARAYRDSPWR